MPKRQIEWYPTQYHFIASPDRFTAMIGGIGSGKSRAGAGKALLHCKDKCLGLVVAPTYPMLRDATWRTLQEVAAASGLPVSLNKSEFTARIGNAEMLMRSADQPDRLRGPNINWTWMDEFDLCPLQTWEIVIGRLRADGKAGPAWITSTPKGRRELYRLQDQLTVFRARTQDNPYLDPEFVRSLEAAYTGQFAAQELGGEFVSFEGLVYEEFDRGQHIQQPAGSYQRVVAGVDEGYTNPAVIVVLGVDNDGRAAVIAEFYQRRALQAEVIAEAQRLMGVYKIERFFCDPSAAGLIADMRAQGLPVKAADNAIVPGLQAVKAHLVVQGDGKPRLTVVPGCVNLVAEFESYCWKKGQAGMKDEPEKVNDHAMDALRYAVMGISGPVGQSVAIPALSALEHYDKGGYR